MNKNYFSLKNENRKCYFESTLWVNDKYKFLETVNYRYGEIIIKTSSSIDNVNKRIRLISEKNNDIFYVDSESIYNYNIDYEFIDYGDISEIDDVSFASLTPNLPVSRIEAMYTRDANWENHGYSSEELKAYIKDSVSIANVSDSFIVNAK